MSGEHLTWDEAIIGAIDNLPGEWEVEIVIADGGATARLLDPSGDEVETGADGPWHDRIRVMVDHARKQEGLPT